MKIKDAVTLLKNKFGPDTPIKITGEHWDHSGRSVENRIIVWVGLEGKESRQEEDSNLARAVNKLLRDIAPEALENVIEQVEEMANVPPFDFSGVENHMTSAKEKAKI